MNIHTGEIKTLLELTNKERASGDWVELPPHDADGHPAKAIETLKAQLLGLKPPGRVGRFDASGKPVFTNG